MSADAERGGESDRSADTLADVARRHPEGFRGLLADAEELDLCVAESMRKAMQAAEREDGGSA